MKKQVKNKLIMCLIGILLGTVELPILFFIEENFKIASWVSIAYIVVYYILFRLLLKLIQSILVKKKIMKYSSENFNYYDKIERESREQRNLEYKKGMDRFLGRVCFMFCYMLILLFALIMDGRIGIGGAILLVLVVNIPLIIASKPPVDYTYSSGSMNKSEKPQSNEKKFDPGIRRTYFKDKFGNISGSTTSYKVGDVEFTDLKDKNGKVTAQRTSYNGTSIYRSKR